MRLAVEAVPNQARRTTDSGPLVPNGDLRRKGAGDRMTRMLIVKENPFRTRRSLPERTTIIGGLFNTVAFREGKGHIRQVFQSKIASKTMALLFVHPGSRLIDYGRAILIFGKRWSSRH